VKLHSRDNFYNRGQVLFIWSSEIFFAFFLFLFNPKCTLASNHRLISIRDRCVIWDFSGFLPLLGAISKCRISFAGGNVARKAKLNVQAKRCYDQWYNLFFGVLSAINRSDPNLWNGVMRELERVGLAHEGQLSHELLTLDPSQEILDKTDEFRRTARIPNLRGKTRRRSDILSLLVDYSHVVELLKGLPAQRTTRNPYHRKRALKDRLRDIDLPLSLKKNIPEELFTRCSVLPPKKIALRVVSHLHDMRPATLKRQLSRARKKYPDEAHLWKHGLKIVVVEK
jgi:hypothetical protein